MRLSNFRLQKAGWTASLLFHQLRSCQLSGGGNAFTRLLQMKDLILCLLFFFPPLPPFTIIRKSCFSFRIRQLFFCLMKTSRKQTEPHFHINVMGTGLRDDLASGVSPLLSSGSIPYLMKASNTTAATKMAWTV